MQDNGVGPTEVEISSRAGIRAGHFLKTTYPILSKGDGAEADFIFLMTLVTARVVKRKQFICISGVGGVGIQPGCSKKFRGSD